MTKFRKKELKQALIKIDNPYPNDDLILTYAGFLKVRDFLGYYQFNPVVFENLLTLANDLWKTEKRINRFILIKKIKQYYHGAHGDRSPFYTFKTINPGLELSLESRKLIFNLFKKLFDERHYIGVRQLDDARRICNGILINKELTPDEEEWLCANADKSTLILNRVLRYPIQSIVISQWAKKNFKNNLYRHRRAELLSWIIDKAPDYKIDKQTLVDDFEYLNESDLQAIQDYKHEIEANEIIEREFGDYFHTKKEYDSFDNYFENYKKKKGVELETPELKLTQRPYGKPIDLRLDYPANIPNFEEMSEVFYRNLPTHQLITMIWSIGYSRLDNPQKSELLKKYYTNETYFSMFKVAKRDQNSELLKWLLEQQ